MQAVRPIIMRAAGVLVNRILGKGNLVRRCSGWGDFKCCLRRRIAAMILQK